MKKLKILILSLLIPFTAFPFEAKSEEINNECATVTSVQEYKNCLRRVIPINPNYVSSESISEIEIVKVANDDLYNEAVQAFKDKKENEALSKVNAFLAAIPNAKNYKQISLACKEKGFKVGPSNARNILLSAMRKIAKPICEENDVNSSDSVIMSIAKNQVFQMSGLYYP